MNESLIIAFLALLSIGSLAAVFVLWAKLDEQKKLTQEERDKRWDEISRAESIENRLEDTEKEVQQFFDDARFFLKERNSLQDKLSALLCPTNNHVWKDGVCVKCGRVNESRSD